MHRPIDPDIHKLRDKILMMGGAAENAIARATQALVERDSSIADQVIRDDDRIDQLELELDEACIETLVLQQPAASDLRFVVGVAKAAPNIERIADHAVNICKHVIKLNNEPQLKAYVDIPKMSAIVQEMLVAGLDAFTSVDPDRAWDVIRRDDEVDELHRKVMKDLTACMMDDPASVPRAVELMFVSKHLERIADYVTNLCELVVYIKRGNVIKHVIEE
ncbi:MAG: phosphate signaling complex protein PhoU [Blastocatellia bacterium]|jgi:phosphate transport system protein|nr:phosphate signaling complex protein PhoU [Blastocatellia bacterium]MBK6428865.1 phosphate signaling complex protein PhoU [Blastocatellia bacterium]